MDAGEAGSWLQVSKHITLMHKPHSFGTAIASDSSVAMYGPCHTVHLQPDMSMLVHDKVLRHLYVIQFGSGLNWSSCAILGACHMLVIVLHVMC